jgi:hypothetical protein
MGKIQHPCPIPLLITTFLVSPWSSLVLTLWSMYKLLINLPSRQSTTIPFRIWIDLVSFCSVPSPAVTSDDPILILRSTHISEVKAIITYATSNLSIYVEYRQFIICYALLDTEMATNAVYRKRVAFYIISCLKRKVVCAECELRICMQKEHR